MKDNTFIHLEFNESPILVIESLIENNMKCPAILLMVTEYFNQKIKN